MSSRASHLVVRDLVTVGRTLGMEMAERLYLALAAEPRDAQGDRIDWLVIRARIGQADGPALSTSRLAEGTVLESESPMAT